MNPKDYVEFARPDFKSLDRLKGYHIEHRVLGTGKIHNVEKTSKGRAVIIRFIGQENGELKQRRYLAEDLSLPRFTELNLPADLGEMVQDFIEKRDAAVQRRLDRERRNLEGIRLRQLKKISKQLRSALQHTSVALNLKIEISKEIDCVSLRKNSKTFLIRLPVHLSPFQQSGAQLISMNHSMQTITRWQKNG